MASDYKVAIKIAGELESSFGAAIKGAKEGLGSLGTIGNVGQAVMKATGTSLAIAGGAMAAFGSYAIQTGKEFESAMSSAAATAGATPEEFQKMSNAAREMGRATTKTAAESANALEYMALAGWDVETSISALPSVLRLSEASGLDLARTSDLVTDSMSALGVSVEQLPGYLDIAARAQNKSNQTAEQLMEAYIGVGGTLKGLGVPVTESATALGVLANRGIKGSEAGNALNAVLVNLTTGTGQAGAKMKELGISAFDSEGKFIGLEGTLQQVNGALAGMTDEQRNATLAAIGGKQHVDALNALMSGLNDTTADGRTEWAALTSELENCNGALEEMAATKTDNLEGNIARMQSAMADFGIEIHQSGLGPLNDLVKFGTDAFNELGNAFRQRGFTGLADALGGLVAEGLQRLLDAAPEFVNMAATLVDSVLTGIEQNADKIGQGAAKLITTLAQAFIRIASWLIVVGAKLIVEIAKGLVENFPALKDAAAQAIEYLMTEAKNALKSYTDFLGDDSVKPFEKFLALLPAVAGGFAAFKGISAITGKVKGFFNTLKGVKGVANPVRKGMGGAANAMSSAAKNMLGAGAGIALAAAGVWLLADAAIRIADAGPGAAVALAIMGAGIAAFMVIASKVGPQLQASQQGLLAFGGAILMAAGGMALMAFAAAQMAAAGPLAAVGLGIMVGGMAALLFIAGQVGPQLTTASGGLLAFGGAILMASAGMFLIAQAAVQIANAGPLAAVGLGIMVGGMALLLGVAGAVGPALTASAVGLLAFGAAMLMISASMMIMTQAALQITAAGPGAGAALALMLAGVLAFGAAAGALAPLLLAGGAALMVFGAGLAVVGAGLMVVALAAQMGATALQMIAAVLPQLAEFGASGAVAILELAAALTAFSGAAALVAGGATLAAGGLTLFAGAAGLAVMTIGPLGGAMASIGSAVTALSMMAPLAGAGLKTICDAAKSAKSDLQGIDQVLQPLAAALSQIAGPAAGAGAALTLVAAAVSGIGTAGMTAAMGVMLLAASLQSLSTGVTAFISSTQMLQTAVMNIQLAFATLSTAAPPVAAAMTSLALPATMVSAAFAALGPGVTQTSSGLTAVSSAAAGAATSMQTAAAGAQNLAAAGSAITSMTAAVSVAMTAMGVTITTAMTQAAAAVRSGMQQMTSAVTSGMNGIVSAVRSAMNQFAGAVRSGVNQAVSAARSGASQIRSAFSSINLSSAGAQMMRGLVNGINSMRGAVMAAARSVAQAAAQSVNAALKIHSPSRVAMEQGQFYDQGLVGGLQEGAPDIAAAARNAIAEPLARAAWTDGPAQRRADAWDYVADRVPAATVPAAAAPVPPANITFSPQITINGPADKETVTRAVRLSFKEFEKMMREYERRNARTRFAQA